MCNIICCIQQVSLLGPLFLIYVKDLCKASTILKPVMFVDDTNLFLSNKDINKPPYDMIVELQRYNFRLRQISYQ